MTESTAASPRGGAVRAIKRGQFDRRPTTGTPVPRMRSGPWHTRATTRRPRVMPNRRAYGTQPESDPPFVRPAQRTGVAALVDVDWLDLASTSRALRTSGRRSAAAVSPPITSSCTVPGPTSGCVALDPLRFALEFEDARRSNGLFPVIRDVNAHELIKAMPNSTSARLSADPRGNSRPTPAHGPHGLGGVDRRDRQQSMAQHHQQPRGLPPQPGPGKQRWEVDLWGVQPIIRDPSFDARDRDAGSTVAS